MLQKYCLGCPIWGNKDWVGEVFAPKTKPTDYLQQYAKVFNTVEGNNTFYGLPKREMVQRWKVSVPDTFQFSFKFPKIISHVHKLQHSRAEVKAFFKALTPLLEQVGVFFLQLPPSFNRKYLQTLERFLMQLPTEFTYAVEVRHLDFFDEGDTEKRFDDLLRRLQMNRALFHTETLHRIQTTDEGVLVTQRKKPKMPTRFTTTAQRPFFRFVGHPTVELNMPTLKIIAQQVANWIKNGQEPFVFMHTPGGDFYAPHLARQFHQLLTQALQKRTNINIGMLPIWPAEKVQQLPKQMRLF